MMPPLERPVRTRGRTGAAMNRLATTVTLIATLGALTAGCADPDGLRAEGLVSLTVHQSGQPDGPTGFNLPADTFIDPPPGVGRGFFGTCEIWLAADVRKNARADFSVTRARSASSEGSRVVVLGSSNTALSVIPSHMTILGRKKRFPV